MVKPNGLPEFESLVRKAMDVPEPDATKLDALRERFIAYGASMLQSHPQPTPVSNRTRPEKESTVKSITSHLSTRLAWSLALLATVVLLSLVFSSPEIVSALHRLLGYIPGIGVVEPAPSMRMLSAPMSVTRENITVSVDQAVLTGDKTVVMYSYRTPLTASPGHTPRAVPNAVPALVLPDGTRLKIKLGHRVSTDGCPECGDMRYAMEFAPIPSNVDKATLELPILAGLQPGAAPENWEIKLTFGPADPSAILPVIEYQPTPAPANTANEPTATSSADNHGISVAVDKAVELPDGFLLIGTLQWTDTAISQGDMISDLLSIRDANGLNVNFVGAQPDAYPQPDELWQPWAYRIPTKSFTPPLTLKFSLQAIISAQNSAPIPGNWTVTWNPPASAHILTPAPSMACVTEETWSKALQTKALLPPELSGKLSLEADEADHLTVANLDGSAKKEMSLGNFGSSLSPDGTRIVHSVSGGSGPSNGLFITDLATGTTSQLAGTTVGENNPLWSPDGSRIVFTRSIDSGNLGPQNIVIINVDGSNLKQLTFGEQEANQVTAWMPDSIHIIYKVVKDRSSAFVNLMNVETGEVTPLFKTSFAYSSIQVSADGKRVAFEDLLPDERYALVVSDLNGANRKLLLDGNPILATSPHWSPDGKWVIVSVQTELPSSSMITLPTLIQVDTCEIIPLPYLAGYVSSWVP